MKLLCERGILGEYSVAARNLHGGTMWTIKVIRSQIKYYENTIKQDETGTVLMVGDGIARVSGLTNCMSGELLEFEDGTFGMAQNLEENSVSIVLFGDDSGTLAKVRP